MAALPTNSTTPRRTLPELSEFTSNISNDAPTGISLRYDNLYDEIRLSRQEDDPRLSMGIWKTDIKKADWNKIESLCIEALTKKSKDIQIAAWLVEAWTALDGIIGYIRGIQITSAVCETFWKDLYPLPQDDGDMENRYMIFEWMDTTFTSRLLTIPLTQSRLDQSAYGLGYYKSAQHGDAASRRADQSRNVTTDPAKVLGSLDDFQKSMDQTADVYLTNLQMNLATALTCTQTFKDVLTTLMGKDAPAFIKIFGALKEMDRIIKSTLQVRQPPPPEPEPEPDEAPPISEMETDNESSQQSSESVEAPAASEISNELEGNPKTNRRTRTREDAYRELEAIANFLDQYEPNSLAPQLIRQLVRWEHKNIVDVFSEIAKTPQEYEILMKILGNPKVED